MARHVPSGLIDLATADVATARRLVAPFPKTHDLSRLVDAIRVSQPTFPEFSLESAVLTEYAVAMRYEPEGLPMLTSMRPRLPSTTPPVFPGSLARPASAALSAGARVGTPRDSAVP